ncbi:Hypothetical predicted protein [Lecanosticta acicola]|uniref:Uncharacterized protein n=1 Tax=Lecanosticta acicola TaxID=111012 RepID=A0AAI8Z6V0_9PEZI|nr:Hypothetical predicted protein [Lecanosticta acicola]
MDSPSSSGRRRTSRRKSGDNNVLKQKLQTITISDNSDDAPPPKAGGKGGPVVSTTPGRFTRSSLGKGKALAHDTLDDDDEDQVLEYEFTSEDEVIDGEDELDDVNSVITLSSDDSDDLEFDIPSRPWKLFSLGERKEWELMYANVATRPIGGSWETTENYQREKDEEMQSYLEDHPLDTWVIPRDLALNTYHHALERARWRTLGIPIYQPASETMSGGLSGPQIQSALNVPRNKYPREPQSAVPRPPPPGPPSGPPPQQQHAQQMPPRQQPPLPPPGPPSHGPAPGYAPGYPPYAARQGPPPPPASGNLLPPQHYVAQPMHMQPGMGRPVGAPQTIPYGMPPNFPPHGLPSSFPPSESTRRPTGGGVRQKRETPINSTPPPPPPTPPYPARQRPGPASASASAEKKESTHASIKIAKPARQRVQRRQAEAEEFPWTRTLIDFPQEKAKAKWDDTIYDAEELAEMDAVRARNVPIIDDLDAKVQEQQRIARQAKKKKDKDGEKGDETEDDSKEKKKMQRGQRKGESGGDPYHSGAFAFASEEDEQKAVSMGFKAPDEAIEAGKAGKHELDELAKIKICWNPGKKGMTENLEQVKFSVKDTVVTRKQLGQVKILTHRAAECVIDFCPDLLWRGMLLRICSEGGHGNKDVRDRFCYNGCYCDKATITKRISAALGQKQQQPKSKGYGDGEWEWYEENVKDFAKYIDYFGKRSSHRNMLKIQMQGEKRKQKMKERAEQETKDSGSGGEGPSSRKPSKRAKLDDGKDTDDAAAESDAMDVDVDGDGQESDGSDDSNAVSIQDSDILDKMED